MSASASTSIQCDIASPIPTVRHVTGGRDRRVQHEVSRYTGTCCPSSCTTSLQRHPPRSTSSQPPSPYLTLFAHHTEIDRATAQYGYPSTRQVVSSFDRRLAQIQYRRPRDPSLLRPNQPIPPPLLFPWPIKLPDSNSLASSTRSPVICSQFETDLQTQSFLPPLRPFHTSTAHQQRRTWKDAGANAAATTRD